ncbi:MAG: hypothetical protein P8K76_10415 [Candidatus Binatia bacterium]|nr:hypothetical protein [Candidatus Binatia bacterium]MDG2010184.1 hypothetical protein [Candidatus Binatia bacterium]
MGVDKETGAGREIEVWEQLCEELKGVGRRVLETAPADPLDRAEGLRYVARLTSVFLRMMTSDPVPARQPLLSQAMKVGLDNPDYAYCRAGLDPRFAYVLSGDLGDASSLGIGTFSGNLGSPEGLIRDGYVETGGLRVSPGGQFELSISLQEQDGNWLPMKQGTNSLQVRQVLPRRREQRPANLELRKLDDHRTPSPLDPDRFLASLGGTPTILGGTIEQFLGWTAHFQSHLHEIQPIPESLIAFAQGDPSTSYNYSYWELNEDEALVINFTPPPCDYWNLQIGNHWLESLDYFHRDTHVNQETVVLAADGSAQVVVARQDPGLPNWLDTAGHVRGGLALRWVGASEIPGTKCEVVSLASLAGLAT